MNNAELVARLRSVCHEENGEYFGDDEWPWDGLKCRDLMAAAAALEQAEREKMEFGVAVRDKCADICRKEWQETSSLCRSSTSGDLMKAICAIDLESLK